MAFFKEDKLFNPPYAEPDPSLPPLDSTVTPDPVPDAVPDELITTEDRNHPIHWPGWKKWLIAIAYSLLQVLVTMQSTSYVSAEPVITQKYGGSDQVVGLGQSLFILGTAVGPAFLGPLSDIGGRKWVYVVSILLYGVLQIVSE